ncbi:DUF5753 domain-containing protein [Streptomyces sp. WM6378]|uniref:DUF5753 domain-containing protein n=1 Tax=Streptomyces sp. WM6378 TaxID=1415557 RepID=UPI0006BF0ECF|nr:DUF5753 domain-containing protein [Streptomyces sp. WM6378]KOU35248.1 hypothetical protein ADK54_38095 [Streptomyces sp. WM6378]
MPPRRVVTGRSKEPRQRFAEELRQLRAESGTSLRQPGERLGRQELLEGEGALPFRTILSETALRTAMQDDQVWREQLEHVAELALRPNVAVHVLPFSAGLHGLDSTDLSFLRQPDGRTVAYTENAYRGDLIDENGLVERLQRSYDAVGDMALPPAESRKFILGMLEAASCNPST